MNIKTLLDIKHPIIQAPMAGVQNHELAAAVCNTGALGSIPCGMLTVEQIVQEIQALNQATSNPYNVNFFCHQMPDVDRYNKTKQQWRSQLTPYFNALNSQFIEPDNPSLRIPFNDDIADAIEPFRPPIISFHFGLPDKKLMQRIKQWDSKVISSATTVKEALYLEAHGVDAIIAQGIEAGGHRGMFLSTDLTTQVGTLALITQIKHHVNVPVIAAGGIANSQSVQAAFHLGASAAQLGTIYLLCHEAKTTKLHRQQIRRQNIYKDNAISSHTALTNIFTGRPARGIVNQAMKELGYINKNAPDFPLASIEMAQLRALYEKENKGDFSPLWCGQNTLGCKEVSAAELTMELIRGLV